MNYQIQTLNAISPAIYTQLGEHYHVSDHAEQPDAILVRSASMHDLPLAPSVLCIARAGAGTNNIPIDACTQAGVCVLNTPGANANAVCEMVLAAMLLSCRDIVGGIEWARGLKGQGDGIEKAVEKGKKAFVGPELRGKTLGVIGLGAIGVLVANAAVALGMNVVGYDPMISVEHAWKLSQRVKEKGYALIPLKVYLTRGKIKLELGTAKGKTFEDKRETLKKRQDDLDVRREVKIR